MQEKSVKIWGLILVLIFLGSLSGSIASAGNLGEFSATAYYCVYDSEMSGTQTVTKTISGTSYTLKASFLFGGKGVAMQGTGRTGPSGDHIHYTGNGGGWAHINDPLEFTNEVRQRYTNLGITDFTGFGNLALTLPNQATYSRVSGVTGASGRTLIPWYSIAVDPSEMPLGTTGMLLFKSGTTPQGATQMSFRADDTGGGIVGKKVDIYVGEGQSALNTWYQTGDNRNVEVLPAPIFTFDSNAEGWTNQATEPFSVTFAPVEGFGGGGALAISATVPRDSYQIVHDEDPDWPTAHSFFQQITFDVRLAPGVEINALVTGMQIRDNVGSESNVYLATDFIDLGGGWTRVVMAPTNLFDLPQSHDDVGINLHIGTTSAFTNSLVMFIDNIAGVQSVSIPVAIDTSDISGNKKDTFFEGESVYVIGSGYAASTSYNLYVVEDTTWNDGMPMPPRVPGTVTSVTTDSSGNIPAETLIWASATIGKYDIVVDVNGNKKYDIGIDPLDDMDVNEAGFETIPEFTTIAIPVTAILGLMFLFSRRKRKG